MTPNPFEAYAKRATSVAPPKLIGPTKTRVEARARYSEIVSGLDTCSDKTAVDAFLAEHEAELTQYHAELQFLWEGDGDFAGLHREIERAQVRVDKGLDYPRYEEKELGQ